MKAVTIDQLGIENHKRYAEDQEALDPTFIKDAAPYTEIVGTSPNYSSHWDQLFELSARNHPWADFHPPPNYALLKRRRFFTLSIIPSLERYNQDNQEGDTEQEQGESNHSEQEEEKPKAFAKEKECLLSFIMDQSASAPLERERSILLNLLTSIEELDELLQEIHSRKLQYQKG